MSHKHQDSVEFGLLENGLDFIQSAINYLIKSQDKYDIKYGLLHLSSGVELVFKYRLLIEDWELLFQDIKKLISKISLMVTLRVWILKHA